MTREKRAETATCENCGGRLSWHPYTLVSRPDVLRRRDDRAPIGWAWHCRCGMWVYDLPAPPRS